MNIRPLKNNIIVEKVESTRTTASGIALISNNGEPDKAKVVAIGNDVEGINVDDLLLVNWNKASELNNGNFRITDEDVIGVYYEE